jgi:hypothetical protein
MVYLYGSKIERISIAPGANLAYPGQGIPWNAKTEELSACLSRMWSPAAVLPGEGMAPAIHRMRRLALAFQAASQSLHGKELAHRMT